MITLGVVLMAVGILMPLLMILQLIPTGFILAFVSYACSLGGLVLAIVGLATYVRANRHIDYH